MRKMTLVGLLVLLVAGSVSAHNGALNLYYYKDLSFTDCDHPISAFMTDTINLYYIRDLGYDMGNAAEFMGVLSDVNAIFTPPPTWSSQLPLTLGTLETGISLTGTACLGVSEPVVFLGEIYVLSFGASEFTFRIVNHPVSNGIFITRCNPAQDVVPVLGGTFVFSNNDNACDPGVKSATWSAIKSLYK